MRRTRSTDKTPGNIRRTVSAVLLIISLAIGTVAIYKAVGTLLGYAFADIEHREIMDEVIENPEEIDKENAVNASASKNEIIITMGGDELVVKMPVIDHNKLKKMNPDYVGWLYVPYSKINYPVCKGSNDTWYLNHTFKGKENDSGCLFLNSKTKEKDPVWFIYGHNMKNDAMFGALDEISSSGVNRMYLICPDKTYEFKFYSAHYTNATSDTYSIPLTAEAKRSYYDKEIRASEKVFNCVPRISEKTIVLSTCHGETGGDGRYVVLAAGTV